jgi:glutathione S-transferase
MRLVYFDFPGRGEAVRDALRIGAVPFEDERIGFEEFRARRAAGALPFDVLPVLVLDDGTVLSQSNTILRFVAARAGLVPADPIDALRVDELLDAAEDYGGRLSVSIRIQDEAVRAVLRAELAQRWLPEWFAILERSLGAAGRGWLVGGALSVADLKIVHAVDKLVNGTLTGIPTDLLAASPALEAWRARVHAARRAAQG